MSGACPVQTPAERERSLIVSQAATALLETVLAAVKEADEATSAALRAAGAEDVASLHGFFAAGVHQQLYCVLCGADPKTFSGGNPTTALAIIRNSQQIAKHYWGADIQPDPQPRLV